MIKQDQIYEARKKALENRVNMIDGLQKNQVSPVVALDVLSRRYRPYPVCLAL